MGLRVVVHIGKSMFYSSRLGVPAILPKLHNDISNALKKEGAVLQCLGVKLSRSKNLIITFPAKSSKSVVAAAFHTFVTDTVTVTDYVIVCACIEPVSFKGSGSPPSPPVFVSTANQRVKGLFYSYGDACRRDCYIHSTLAYEDLTFLNIPIHTQ